MLADIAKALDVPVDFFYERDVLLANIMLALKILPREELAGLWLFVKGRLPPDIPSLDS